ncbi:hypothetical protein [Caulobacter sp. Root1472]|uniref:hypothetical protein n=1 Tax=Caulobacter sp. Root1472 TaxID=1736470 RepID=UPI000AE34EC0|nr:hypothetical protein [Caulobacter sp. Root1472]
MTSPQRRPHCLDVPSWRKFTREEHLEYIAKLQARTPSTGPGGGALVVRHRLSTLDMYCYLRARFGTPNGIQNFLRRDDSDNLVHWDFNLRAGDADLYVMATSREVQFMIAEPMSDEDWKTLILAIKADFARVGPEKKAELDRLEKWTLFPNKYVAIAGLCADHHGTITDVLAAGDPFAFDGRAAVAAHSSDGTEPGTGRVIPSADAALYGACLQLALLTPIMAEAFINMVILVLCRPEVRSDKRRYDAFVREQIDLKIADLSYKCQGFAHPIDMKSDVAKAFKRVMDKRNNSIHGNIDPAREGIETVYFDGKRPLYPEGGDHIGKFKASLAKHYKPQDAVADYEATHMMLLEIAGALEPNLQDQLWMILGDSYPGFDERRQKVGKLFPDHYVGGYLQGLRYDDDLHVEW